MQPAIDAAALELMREFNTTGGEEEGPGGNDDREGSSGSGRTLSSSPPSFAVPTVYNTTQCYLRGAEEKLRGELELAAASTCLVSSISTANDERPDEGASAANARSTMASKAGTDA